MTAYDMKGIQAVRKRVEKLVKETGLLIVYVGERTDGQGFGGCIGSSSIATWQAIIHTIRSGIGAEKFDFLAKMEQDNPLKSESDGD
jgi:hypothetical protein